MRPALKIQTGTGEFEAYATAVGLGQPDLVTLQWTRAHANATGAVWEVQHGGSVVKRGSAGAAPAVGQTKLFSIDFKTFLALPAPATAAKYVVRLRETKSSAATSPRPLSQAVESNYLVPGSNPVIVTYAAQPETVFTEEGIPEEDKDHDGLTDATENALAAEFRPYFIFDAEESDRRPNEPVVIYQVQCVAGSGPSCTRARIRYYYLFQRDGGWQSCSPWCGNSHNGDNQRLDLEISLHLPEKTNPYRYWWPVWGGERYQAVHPILYLSAGKHHDYLSTDRNHEDNGGCCDDVAGDGDQVFPDVFTGTVYHNVGERSYRLLDDLGFLGFQGECAWCGKAFRGGLEDDDGDSTPCEWW